MPAFYLEGDLIYFAAFKNHIGMYPPVLGDAALRNAMTPYLAGKGNLKFALDKPVPYTLIKRIVKARLNEHVARNVSRS